MKLNYKTFFEIDSSPKYFGESGAGALIIAKDTGKILLLHRSHNVEEPGTWGCVGGKVDGEESPKETVSREVEEETGYDGITKVSPLHVYKDGNFRYYNFLVIVQFEFTPQLNWESDGSSWVEYGDWPEPLHFGLEELFLHNGSKIKNVIDLIKKKRDNLFEMDTPPAIIQSTNHLSNGFTNYIKSVENAKKDGFENGKWYPHQSPEGGSPTIGYGHKIQKNEIENLTNGISNSAVENLLKHDLEKAKEIVYSDPKSMTNGANIPLDERQEEMLTDYAFNLGTIKKFPKFVRAVLDKDWDTARKEYKRTYGDSSGNRHDLTRRNQIFFDRYLKPAGEIKENINDFSNVKVGTPVDDVYEYKLTSPYSYISYTYDPHNKLFSLNSVRTIKPENMNKGYATNILEYFFSMIRASRGTLDVGGYTTSGESHIKHVIERLAKQYGVRLI